MPFDPDTTLGGRQDRFPSTRRSVLAGARAEDEGLRREALGRVIEAYWKPLYKYLRLKWNKSNEEAKDLTQAFFASLLERGLLERYDARRAAFRTYLRTCADSFVMHEAEAAARLKRGGGQSPVSLDFEAAECDLADEGIGRGESMEQFFHREWQRQLFSLAVDDLRQACEAAGRQIRYRLFEQYDLWDGPDSERPTYGLLAREHGLPVTAVTNHLAWARRELRLLLLDRLAGVTGGTREFRREARGLLGGAR
jgi:RNA polymerase sigma factor (sigma-70 family)